MRDEGDPDGDTQQARSNTPHEGLCHLQAPVERLSEFVWGLHVSGEISLDTEECSLA